MKILKDNWPYLLLILVYIVVALFLHDDPGTKQLMAKKIVDMTIGEGLFYFLLIR